MVRTLLLEKSVRLVCGVALLGALTACNTLGGAGRDVSAVGNAVSSGANSATPAR